MSALSLSSVRTAPLLERVRDLADAVYEAPAPTPGHGIAAKIRFAAYVAGSAIGWAVAALVVTGLLASLFR